MDSLAGLRIAIYARFSSDNQKDTSIADQLRLCREFLARRDGNVPDELVFDDHAVSGASKDRPRFERMMKLVEARAIDVVVTESMDRLSRDLGDADRLWKLIDYYRVRLICVSDGIDSANEGSRMQFRFKAIFADEFLVDLGKKTRRGQRGAAGRKTSTGGLPYGYCSRPIWTGEREPSGFEILINEEQAAVVRRIFGMYRDGYSYLTIASTLNAEGIAPPRANSRKRPSRFWKKGTIREMLRNSAYAGHWSFGRKEWRKDPTTRKRRYTKRAASEVLTDHRPHLCIVSEAVWEAVRVRRTAVSDNYAGKTGGVPGRRTSHPFSGLLYCGVCGARMVDGGGSSARYYRCSGAVAGGVCGNRRPIREDVLIDVAVAELRRVLLSPELNDLLREKVEARLARLKTEARKDERHLVGEVARVDKQVERLLDFIKVSDLSASPGAYEALRADLEQATRKQRELRAKLDAAHHDANLEARIPTIEEIVAGVLDVESRLKDDPTGAREALRRLVFEGAIHMDPQEDGSYRARSFLLPENLAHKSRKPRAGRPSGASGVSHEVVGNGSCAGRI